LQGMEPRYIKKLMVISKRVRQKKRKKRVTKRGTLLLTHPRKTAKRTSSHAILQKKIDSYTQYTQ